MKLENIESYEIEITSKCNARCPGCSRTLDGETHPNLKMLEISLDDFKNIFPRIAIEGKRFGFSGVYGDPGMAKDIIPICEYLLENNCTRIYLDTNGGMQTKEFWSTLSALSKKSVDTSPQLSRLVVRFNVDGFEKTNHLYRVNVNWDKLVENMTAYSQSGGIGHWQYIVFDHNEDDLDLARNFAKELGFNFKVRRSSRNKRQIPWEGIQKKKENGKIKKDTVVVSTTKDNLLHTKADEKYHLSKEINTISNTKFNDINCRLIHQRRVYISHDMKLWPCCWFGDIYHDNIRTSIFKSDRDKFFKMEKQYGEDWNDVSSHSIQDILKHEYYEKTLQESWDTEHDLYVKRCVIECGGNGSRSKIEYIEGKPR